MEFTLTSEQEAICQAINSSSNSVLVEAGAGCAKTSTLTEASQRVRVPSLAIAFNKRIADELSKRMPGNFTCKTMNALGHNAWAKARGVKGNGMRLETQKSGKLLSEVWKSRRTHATEDQWDFARQLFREAQIQGLVPEPFGSQFTTLVPDTHEGWQSLADDLSIPEDDFEFVWNIARTALVEDIRMAYQGIISFDDQIYCSTLLGGSFTKYDMVFVDEDQDLSPLQIRMVAKSIKPDSRIMAVGDRCQSIYAFRGAVGEAAQQIKALLPNWTELPLMTSFRCPKLVADRQRGHVPLFRAAGTNPNGKIVQLGLGKRPSPFEDDPIGTDGWNWKDVVDIVPDWPTDTAILCRNNAPLMGMAFKLIRQGVGCHVLGRDLSKGLKALTKKLVPDDNTPADTVRGKINDWLTGELSKARINDKPDIADKFQDKADSILAIMESAECRDAGELRGQIDKLFSRDSGVVTLSTIHKAKGLEWPAVIHLDPFRLPSKWATKPGGRQLEQEHNLKYVAETRTKHTLIMANLEEFQ
jgi:DNA helicase II / ATP-dependent DNA helicase PcrA